MEPSAVLVASSIAIMFLTLIAVSYKIGFVSYSPYSMSREDQPRHRIKKDKLGKFMQVTLAVFLANVIFCCIIVRDINEVWGILAVSIFNTVVISFGLSFWILLEEKKRGKSN